MNQVVRRWIGAVAVAGLLAPVGCMEKSTSNVVVTQTAGNATSALVVHDKELAKRVRFMEHRAVPRGDGIEAYAVVQNITDYSVRFEYKVEWFDANDISIETPITSWKPVKIAGRETKSLREVSPRADATGFKLYIRDPNAVER